MNSHGMSSTPTYMAWKHMRRRCLDKKSPDHSSYGGAGIKFCDRWQFFENFYSDMGERPEGAFLDRKNNKYGYEPWNCRWVTPKESSRNRSHLKSAVINGIKLMRYEWVELSSIKRSTISLRLIRGWRFKDAVLRPVGYRRPK